MTPSSPPRVSIGIPVFNMERTVARAVDSVLAQTLGDFELLVADNASSDGTETIARRLAARDPRVHYTRHPRTIGAWDNFRFVLDTARAPYFMWLSADDYLLPGLLEQAAAVLDARPDVVCVAPRTEFLDTDGSRRPAAGTFPLLGGVRDNLCRFLADPSDNSRFYGLHRRPIIRGLLPAGTYYGLDWAVMAATLLHGKHVELPEVLLVREASDRLKYTRSVDTLIPGRLARLLPLARFTGALLLGFRVPPHPRVLGALLRLNAIHHMLYCQYRYPRYGRLVHRVGARLERLGPGGGRARGRRPAA
jgi:glycosyltransferase involved in cell wall biosynthesis